MRRLLVLASAFALVGATAGNSFAYSGGLDPTFSTDGIVPLGRVDNALVAARSDGVVLTLTQVITQGTGASETTIRAFAADGTLATAFSGDGVATPRLPARGYPTAIAVDDLNRIVVLGMARDPFVARFTSDGLRDMSFANDGVRTLPRPRTFPTALAIDTKKRLVVIMTQWTNRKLEGSDTWVTRLLGAGKLDVGFGIDGSRRIDRKDFDWDTVVDTDLADRPVIGGGAFFRPGPLTVTRLTEGSGRLDSSFDVDGVAQVGFGVSSVAVVTTIRAGATVTVGGVLLQDAQPAVAARVLDDGSLDPTFGGDGKVTFATGNKQGMAATAVDDLGAVVAAGYSQTSRTTSQPLVAGVLPDGSADTGFGPAGRAVLPVGEGRAEAGPGIIVAGQFLVLVRSEVDKGGRTVQTYQLVRLGSPSP